MEPQKQMDQQQKVKLLEQVKALIEQGWCQHISSLDNKGRVCDPNDVHACDWCLTGAVNAVCHESWDQFDLFYELHNTLHTIDPYFCNLYEGADGEDYLDPADSGSDLIDWNDSLIRSQHDVIDLLAKTIERLKDGTVEKRCETGLRMRSN